MSRRDAQSQWSYPQRPFLCALHLQIKKEEPTIKFCPHCGTFMKQTSRGYECPNCGHVDAVELIEVKIPERDQADPVYVIDGTVDSPRVQRSCPECGQNEAYRAVRTSQGEHAGVCQGRRIRLCRGGLTRETRAYKPSVPSHGD